MHSKRKKSNFINSACLQTCATCIASGESSCSSALSSLESVRSSSASGYSQGMRSNSGCSETLGSELLNPSHAIYQRIQDHRSTPQKPVRNQQHVGSRNYYHHHHHHNLGINGNAHQRKLSLVNGLVAADVAAENSLRNRSGSNNIDTLASNNSSKPYQTLEVVDGVGGIGDVENNSGEKKWDPIESIAPTTYALMQ
jgi:hypothetical protein